MAIFLKLNNGIEKIELGPIVSFDDIKTGSVFYALLIEFVTESETGKLHIEVCSLDTLLCSISFSCTVPIQELLMVFARLVPKPTTVPKWQERVEQIKREKYAQWRAQVVTTIARACGISERQIELDDADCKLAFDHGLTPYEYSTKQSPKYGRP